VTQNEASSRTRCWTCTRTIRAVEAAAAAAAAAAVAGGDGCRGDGDVDGGQKWLSWKAWWRLAAASTSDCCRRRRRRRRRGPRWNLAGDFRRRIYRNIIIIIIITIAD